MKRTNVAGANKSKFSRPSEDAKPSIGATYLAKLPGENNVKFHLKKLSASDIWYSEVDPHNLRIQEVITRESVSDIYDSIIQGFQQDPCKTHMVNNRQYFLDGSRRRICYRFYIEDIYEKMKETAPELTIDDALNQLTEISMLVWQTERMLMPDECQFLVLESDKRKAFSYYDWGRLFTGYKEKMSEHSGKSPNSIEIGEHFGTSADRVSRCIRAYALPKFLIDCFDISELTARQWTVICQLRDKSLDCTQKFAAAVNEATTPHFMALSVNDRIQHLSQVLSRCLSSGTEEIPKTESQVLFDKGKNKIVWQQKSKSRTVIDIKVPSQKLDEFRAEFESLLKKYESHFSDK
ncbi:hypothetical protein EAY39_08015 [Vibrio anguillarum]|uniref:hypothetical protein n=1 Tax=Vibrio anguillarum TaxID=55601 RepID=UPI000BB50986|nr:hypothetical protein [Vibrio anguillarum]ATC60292.1 hypothetical protein CMV05_23160 [Vibrio anguillarum]MBF4249493.1 hypothetical protein [Vibrio anguillarum]MBF4340733.1 hypothetical protein [Vibrio anguillarum]